MALIIRMRLFYLPRELRHNLVLSEHFMIVMGIAFLNHTQQRLGRRSRIR